MMAKQLAVDLEADLCSTQQEVDDLLAELAAFPPLDAEGILHVHRLAQRVTAAQRITDRTLDRAATDVGGRLAAIGSGVAVHPNTVRERAASVVAARAELAAAADRLRTAIEPAVPAVELTAEPEPEAVPAHLAVTAAPLPEHRLWRWFGRRRARARYEADMSESTSLLHQVAAATDEAFGAHRANESRSDLVVVLEAQRDRAAEDLRVAERAWRDLAGDDDVDDLDAVVRRFDPQSEQARELAQGTVGVRAASALLAQATERWEAGWQSLGVTPAPAADAEWLDQLAERLARPIVVVAEATGRHEELVAAAPAAPVVVVVVERAAS